MPDTKGRCSSWTTRSRSETLASEILRYLGYSVMTAPSGEEAVEAIRNGAHPDVVLLDIIMPGWSGAQTLVELRAIEPDLPILISTGYARPHDHRFPLQDGATASCPSPTTSPPWPSSWTSLRASASSSPQ